MAGLTILTTMTNTSKITETTWQRLPSYDTREAIKRTGTDRQKEDLRLAFKKFGNPDLLKDEVTIVPSLKKSPAEKMTDRQAAQLFINRKMRVKRLKNKPTEVTYETARILFWDFYKAVVRQESGFERPKIDGNMGEKIEILLKWSIGIESEVMPLIKSPFIFGESGTGKSCIAIALQMLMAFYRKKYDWQNDFTFVSMDELFMETYTTQSLAKIGALAAGYRCIDELSEKHLKYKHYGEKHFIINDILAARYALWKRTQTPTIITSNITPDALKARFYSGQSEANDPVLYKRLVQQYEFIVLKGADKRSPKFRLDYSKEII